MDAWCTAWHELQLSMVCVSLSCAVRCTCTARGARHAGMQTGRRHAGPVASLHAHLSSKPRSLFPLGPADTQVLRFLSVGSSCKPLHRAPANNKQPILRNERKKQKPFVHACLILVSSSPLKLPIRLYEVYYYCFHLWPHRIPISPLFFVHFNSFILGLVCPAEFDFRKKKLN